MTRISLGILLLSIAVSAHAKTLYVDTARGNDSVTYEQNSEQTPWQTIGRAAWGNASRGAPNQNQAARAGDTVVVRAGTYYTSGIGSRYEPVYNPVNSGTSAAPIVFEADGAVRLSYTNGSGAMIGTYRRDYISWKGFYINEATAPSVPDTGSIVLWSTTGSSIENCEIDGNGSDGRQDNHNGIRLEHANNVTIRNNRIYNVLYGNGSTHHNGAGIMAYFSAGALIEHNEIYGSGSGIFVKGGDNRDFTVRYNLVRNNSKGILFMYTNAQGRHLVYQNISKDNNAGISIELGSKNVNVVNNTLVGNRDGVRFGTYADTMSNIAVRNNIVMTANEAVSGGEAQTAAPFSLDHNMYYDNAGGWSIAGVAYGSMSAWRAALGGTQAGDDYFSITSNPLFQDVSAGNYRLRSDSAALRAGIDVLDLNRNGSTSDPLPLGAYITGNEAIGLLVGGAAISPPSPPTDLEVIP